MIRERPALFSYPTTWVFVDDHQHFLSSVELALPRNRPAMFWTNPARCLAYLNDLDQQIVSLDSERSSLFDEDLLIRFELDKIVSLTTNVDRFSSLGVLVVDYAMQGLTGLELFSELNNHSVKRVLLTGVADEKVAVEAFNEGLIDRFVLKSDLNAMAKTLNFCSELERNRFGELQQPIVTNLPYDLQSLLLEEDVQKVLDWVITDKDVCEYYFSTKPLGFFCLNSQGQAYFLAFVSKSVLKERFANYQVPQSLLHIVEDADLLVGLFEEPNFGGAESYDWEFNSIRVKPIGSNREIYWGLHNDPPLDVDYESSSCSLTAYLAEARSSYL